MNTDTLASPVFRPANASFCRGKLKLPKEIIRAPLIEGLAAYFINREGDVEPAFPSVRVAAYADGDAGRFMEAEPTFMPAELSETEACDRLCRAVTETGQLVVRTADGLMTAWFAGIGDPDNLFVELRPREIWVEHDELVMGAMCSLSDAERLLRCMYRGVCSEELSVSGEIR